MKKSLIISLIIFAITSVNAQTLKTSDDVLDRAFSLALKTLETNVQDSLIKAGGYYGGEWTRDIAINSWNGAAMIIPNETKFSLWSVTTDNRTMIGHQYWDQILWVIAAYDYYLTSLDKAFLQQAYIASVNTMAKLEKEAFDKKYGMFTGPSVFNDGIAAYEEPIYVPNNTSTYVLDYAGTDKIKCLSTNCIYFEAYNALSKMASLFDDEKASAEYVKKAAKLKLNIRKHLYDDKKGWLNYLVDHNGDVHPHQEALGMAFAIMFGVVDRQEANRIIDKVYVSKYGIPSVYPCFKRFTEERPGRHNVMVWPFVNAFWAEACLVAGREDLFEFELRAMADLAVNKSNNVFYEIYNEKTGMQDGGWQIGEHRTSVHNQTWSATGYIRMVLRGVAGISYGNSGISILPNKNLINKLGFKSLKGLNYRGETIDVISTK